MTEPLDQFESFFVETFNFEVNQALRSQNSLSVNYDISSRGSEGYEDIFGSLSPRRPLWKPENARAALYDHLRPPSEQFNEPSSESFDTSHFSSNQTV